jgi:hypothetical protein
MSLPSSTFNTDVSANKLRQTYVKGYVDISGGDLNIQTGNLNMYNGSTQVKFRIADDHVTVRSYPSNQAVDVSLSQFTYLNTISVHVDNTLNSINQKITGLSYDSTYDRTFVDNDLSLSGNLIVNKKSYFLGDVSMTSNLYLGGDVSFAANTVFTVRAPSYTGSDVPTANTLIKKSYVDTLFSTSDNTWNGLTTFNKYPVYAGGAADPSQNFQFATKAYVDNHGGSMILNQNNIWTGDNSFNRYPTYTGGAGYPTMGNQFATKAYVDNNGGTVLLSSNNIWTGDNSFNKYPTYTGGTGYPTLGNQFATKAYVDNNGGTILLSSNNVWTGNNAFSTYFPYWSGAGGPTQGNQFATKSYVDTNAGGALLSSNNVWTGNNYFNGDVSMGKTLVVVGDVSFNGNLHIGGTLFQYTSALGFDGGAPGTDFTYMAKLDAGGVLQT